MLDFAKLDVVVGDDHAHAFSFVGIGQGKLHLPKGTQAWAAGIAAAASDADRFLAARNAFVSLYHTLRTYRKAAAPALTQDRDAAHPGPAAGREILGRYEGEPVVYYRHLDMLDSILDADDELAILSLAQRIGRSERLDYAKLYRHLDHAVFSDDGSFHVDEMSLPRYQILVEPVEIVQMYCYALVEIKTLLGEGEALAVDIQVLANQFFEQHLSEGDSLFAPDTWAVTLDRLRERLEIVDQHTAFKDEGYQILYEALDRFLNGELVQHEDGRQWGISTFAPVWETLCLVHTIKHSGPRIMACESSELSEALVALPVQLSGKQEWTAADGTRRQLRCEPELVDVFVVNGQEVFPDCVLSRRGVDLIREEVYATYGVDHLGDDTKTQLPVAQAYQSICAGLKVRDGSDQKRQADCLLAVLRESPPGALTAFYIGRAIAGAHQTKTGTAAYGREIVLAPLIAATPVYTDHYVDLLRGMLWETYFNKLDHPRSMARLKHRKSLRCYDTLMNVIAQQGAADPAIGGLRALSERLEAMARDQEADKGRPCTVVDFKYARAAYFDASRDDVRERSLRKQYLYEYLLQRAQPASTEIDSEFWIPDYDAGSRSLVLDTTHTSFMGAGIPLRHLNLAELMRSYVA